MPSCSVRRRPKLDKKIRRQRQEHSRLLPQNCVPASMRNLGDRIAGGSQSGVGDEQRGKDPACFSSRCFKNSHQAGVGSPGNLGLAVCLLPFWSNLGPLSFVDCTETFFL